MSNLTSLCVVHVSVPFSPSSFFVLLCFIEKVIGSKSDNKQYQKTKQTQKYAARILINSDLPCHLFYFFRRKFFFCFVLWLTPKLILAPWLETLNKQTKTFCGKQVGVTQVFLDFLSYRHEIKGAYQAVIKMQRFLWVLQKAKIFTLKSYVSHLNVTANNKSIFNPNSMAGSFPRHSESSIFCPYMMRCRVFLKNKDCNVCTILSLIHFISK